jgi:hypothetical protein
MSTPRRSLGIPVNMHPAGLSSQEEQHSYIEDTLRYNLQFKTSIHEDSQRTIVYAGPVEFRGLCPHRCDVVYSVSCGYSPSQRGKTLDSRTVTQSLMMLALEVTSPFEYAQSLKQLLHSGSEPHWVPGLNTEGAVASVYAHTDCRICGKSPVLSFNTADSDSALHTFLELGLLDYHKEVERLRRANEGFASSEPITRRRK